MADNKVYKNEKYYIHPQASGSGSVSYLMNDEVKLIYLSSEIISKEAVHIFNQNPINIGEAFSIEKYLIEQKDNQSQNYVFEFVQSLDEMIWYALLHKVLNYRKRFTQMASQLINKGAIGDINKLNKEYANWAKENVNPLISFANYFNPLLLKLNLEIDLINTEYPIPIKSKLHDDIIPISSLSTGTKSLLLSIFPIYELNTKDAIILIDEPERSLFPDMQIDLISHYQNLAPDAQFIVATHSPFIAAAFEPEERFILYFDDKGKVAVRRGESPIGDDPNDILFNDFKVDYYNEFGKKAYKEYRDIRTKAISETDEKKKNELILEATKIGDKYNF